jgi:multisubunit Na+/H+ antiporter MnhB subunit
MPPGHEGRPNRILRVALIGCAWALFGVLAWALRPVAPGTGLGPLVRLRLSDAGVENPVTAVLLNFRSYDTLLEIVVLLLAVLGVRAITEIEQEPEILPAGPLLEAFLRSVIPVIVVAAAYLLWAGSSLPGGAFQAGAVLGGAGVLLLLANGASYPWMSFWLSRPLLAMGAVFFTAVGAGVTMTGGHVLEYPRPWAGPLILAIEAAATLSIGAILAALFGGGGIQRPEPAPHLEAANREDES